jgi:hypothetical protein
MATIPTGQYEVQPTGQPASQQYSDISMTGLFNAHVALLNSERQTIWQRYSAMLIANSFILGFLDRQRPVFAALVGILLCAAWAIMTWSGYRLFLLEMAEMRRFVWPGLPSGANPIAPSLAYRDAGDWIYRMAWFVIALFGIAYAKLLILG